MAGAGAFAKGLVSGYGQYQQFEGMRQNREFQNREMELREAEAARRASADERKSKLGQDVELASRFVGLIDAGDQEGVNRFTAKYTDQLGEALSLGPHRRITGFERKTDQNTGQVHWAAKIANANTGTTGPMTRNASADSGDEVLSFTADKLKANWAHLMPQGQKRERKILKGADGYNYYADNGERVLPRVQQPTKPTPAEGAGGPYQGTGINAQHYNILHNGDPSTQVFRAAYNFVSAPQVRFDPASGQQITTTPDMSGFRKPTGAGGAGDQATGTGGPGVSVSKVGGAPGRFTETQSRAMQAGEVIRNSLKVLESNDPEGKALFLQGLDFWQDAASSVPFVGNYLKTPEYQQFAQAMGDAASMILRLETGAAATEQEREDVINRYAPRPGDKPEVVQQKLIAFKRRGEQAAELAGPAYRRGEEGSGAPPPTPRPTAREQVAQRRAAEAAAGSPPPVAAAPGADRPV